MGCASVGAYALAVAACDAAAAAVRRVGQDIDAASATARLAAITRIIVAALAPAVARVGGEAIAVVDRGAAVAGRAAELADGEIERWRRRALIFGRVAIAAKRAEAAGEENDRKQPSASLRAHQ
jgi:hypothetical protein